MNESKLMELGFKEYPADGETQYLVFRGTNGAIARYPNGKFFLFNNYDPDFYGAQVKINDEDDLKFLMRLITFKL